MISNGPSRIFTKESVESWFRKLSEYNWEKQFSSNTLQQGRSFYREGKISGLDISTNQIIFIQKKNRDESYSVIEWREKQIDFRTSLDDENTGRAIAVAGLYELEELISEIHEEDPMLESIEDINEKKENTATSLEEESHDRKNVPDKTEFNYELEVELFISAKKGLVATPQWKGKEGTKIPAYGEQKSKDTNKFDGSTLIQFTRESIEAGFTFNKDEGRFTLSEWDKIDRFALETLSTWEHSFKIFYHGEASLIKGGSKEINWEIEAHSQGSEEMLLMDRFHLGSSKLDNVWNKKISKIGTGTLFLPKRGLVRLNREQVDDFEWWKQNKGQKNETAWPRYMLFSLFARKYLRTRADGKLNEWQSSIRKIRPSKLDSKLSFLREYQSQGVSRLQWLHKLGCHGLLADEMGLGKTVQALAIIYSSQKSEHPDLVVCPASVVPVWVHEVETHFPDISVQVLKHDNTFKDSMGKCLWVASYTQLRRHKSLLDKAKFRYAILDEAQMIKNPQAKVTQACLSIEAKHRLALSGTPIENSALDAWTIFRYLMPGLLGGKKELEKELTKDAQRTYLLLKRQISPFIVRRMKNEVAKELPPKNEAEIPCILNQEQKKLYKTLAEKGILNHGDNLHEISRNSPTHIFSLLTRLRQSCCDIRLLPDSSHSIEPGVKENILVQKLKDLNKNGAKAIIFSQFTSYLAILEKSLKQEIPDLKTFKLTGNTRDRTKPVNSFQQAGQSAVMLASLKAAGLGVTLTAADYVFLMDPWWNPAVEEQAIDRAHRIGRTKPVFIYRFIAKGTIEERVRNLQKEKKHTFDQIIGDMEKPTKIFDYFSSLEELTRLEDIN